MSTNGESLIHLESVSKVFVTDELETHALFDVELSIERREYVVTTRLAGFASFAATCIFFDRYLSTNGPFLSERGIAYLLRRRMMNCSVRLL